MRAEANAVLYGTNHFEFSIGHEGGPSPFNTIRALPQSGISYIKACTVSICTYPWAKKEKLNLMRGWMDEMCKLMMQGGNLQEIKIEIALDCLDIAVPSDMSRFGPLLEPLQRLNGLKSVTVKGLVTEAYVAKLKRIMEGDGSRKYKRKVGADDEEEIVLRPKQKRRNEVSLMSYLIAIPHSFVTVNTKSLCINSGTEVTEPFIIIRNAYHFSFSNICLYNTLRECEELNMERDMAESG